MLTNSIGSCLGVYIRVVVLVSTPGKSFSGLFPLRCSGSTSGTPGRSENSDDRSSTGRTGMVI